MKRIITRYISAAAAVFIMTAGAGAQDVSPAQERFYPDFTEDEMRIEPAAHDPFQLSYGGWITPSIVDDRKGGAKLTTSITTLRLWMHATLWENSYMYIRGRNMHMRVISEDNRSDVDSSENILDLDLAFISMTMADKSLNLQAGRKFFNLGTGLVLNGRGDGAEVRYFSPVADVKVFGLYTGLLQKDANPYNLSSRDLSDGAKRFFTGANVEREIINHNLYLFAMMQIDRADEDSGEKNRYDSQYYGIGSRGVVVDGMDYYAEFIYQRGTNTLLAEEPDINAMAALLGFNYYIDADFKPAVLFQYGYGSGDSDVSDDKDGMFNYFGTYVGGFALRPKLQNLHVFRIGYSMLPLYSIDNKRFNRMTVLGRYTYYMKDKTEGDAGGGLGAIEDERFVGHGIDFSVRWRIYHDLGFFLNYGYFIPGDAFPSGTNDRSFVMAGLNLSF